MNTPQFCMMCGSPLAVKTIEGREYHGCSSPACSFVFWDNPVPVVAAIVEYDGKVLLARNKAWPEKIFALITGFLEKGEKPEDAVLREVKEELGLTGTIREFVGLYSFVQKNELLIVYNVSAAGTIILGDELAEYKLIPPEKVKPWPFGTGPAVRDWLDRHGVAGG